MFFAKYIPPLFVGLLLFPALLHAEELPWIEVDPSGQGFQTTRFQTQGIQTKDARGESKPFTPWGFNYDHDVDGALLEDYWNTDWPRVVEDFQEMKQLGANVVRVHLQFGKFMRTAEKPRKEALKQLVKLIHLAEKSGLYLDITGLGCYHKQDVPPWYDKLDEPARWQAQTVFWSAVAHACAKSPAVFCYDLMNEPVVPAGSKPGANWLGPAFGDKHFVQYIALDRADRARPEIAQAWVKQLTTAIRAQDTRHLITVGLVPWSLNRAGLTSGFEPRAIVDDLDFISVHLYPKSGQQAADLSILKGFAVGKPVVIEETFPLKCKPAELSAFFVASRGIASGWIGFYWGETPEDYAKKEQPTLGDSLTLAWLKMFQQEREKFVRE